MRVSKGFLTAGLAAALLAAVGCGSEERLYDVSGTVTFKGQPVPKGLVFFDPDAAKGTSGGQGFANIKDGKFTTAREGRGVRGGSYFVRVLGYDGKAANELPFGNPLFDEHQEQRELPKAPSELTFDLPVKRQR